MATTKRKNKGFTLIELLLAMAGVAVLLVSVAVTTIQLMNMYHKGLTVKSINQAGREVGDLIRRDGLSAGAGEVRYVSADSNGTQGLGRLCIGSRAYLWNKPENLRASTGVRYLGSSGAPGDQIVLARAIDATGALCQADSNGYYPTEISTVGTMRATETLKGQADLAVYEISSTRLFTRDGDSAYQISYTLGTNSGEEINTTDNSCRTVTEEVNDYNFCAINQFREVISMEKTS